MLIQGFPSIIVSEAPPVEVDLQEDWRLGCLGGRRKPPLLNHTPVAPLQIAAGRPLSISPGLSQSAHRTSDDFVFN